MCINWVKLGCIFIEGRFSWVQLYSAFDAAIRIKLYQPDVLILPECADEFNRRLPLDGHLVAARRVIDDEEPMMGQSSIGRAHIAVKLHFVHIQETEAKLLGETRRCPRVSLIVFQIPHVKRTILDASGVVGIGQYSVSYAEDH